MEPSNQLDLVGALRRRWLLVVSVPVVCALLGLGISSWMTPVYQGTASILVGDFQNGDVSNNEILAMQSLTATYADIARREPVLAPAAEEVASGTDWRALRASTTIRVPNESPQVIEISVEGPDQREVRRAAGAIAGSLLRFLDRTADGGDFVSPQLRRLEEAIDEDQDRVDELSAQLDTAVGREADALAREITRTQEQIADWQTNYAAFLQIDSTSGEVKIRRLGPAESTPHPVRPNLFFNVVVAAFLGLVLAGSAVYLLESRRDRPGRAPTRSPQLALDLSQLPAPVRNQDAERVRSRARTRRHPEGDIA